MAAPGMTFGRFKQVLGRLPPSETERLVAGEHQAERSGAIRNRLVSAGTWPRPHFSLDGAEAAEADASLGSERGYGGQPEPYGI